MVELGQLERRHEDFANRKTRVIVFSVEGLEAAQQTQAAYPHLLVLSDEGRGLSEAAGIIQHNAGPDRTDIDYPTTIVVDRSGKVRWLYRTQEIIARWSPDEVLQAVDQNVK